ncbi:hypothetical protein M9H77_26682 [Catharanthus roseus]|uniref:Uncharacterized protein n=1 Tax=Catharanthus roseus TaxID=4058 RepID=A0ACC0AB91_CATRO|nr:hypothetical protein M9H77_26682 [Catharanthus roseus]
MIREVPAAPKRENANDLSPRMRAFSGLIDKNLVPRSHKSINELRIMDIYLLEKILSSSPVNLPCIIIHSIRDLVHTKRKRVFSYPSLLTDIFWHFEIDFSGEETSSNIINGHTISRSGFEYNEIERRWIAKSGLSRREDFGYTHTKHARHPGKAVADKEEDKDNEEGTEVAVRSSTPLLNNCK